MIRTRLMMMLLTALAVSLLGCSDDGHDHAHNHDHDHDHAHHDHGHEHAGGESHGHHHTAPHGGTLIALGDHFAHAELKLDPDTGKLTCWLLDGEAAGAIRSPQAAVDMTITPVDAAGKPSLQAISLSLLPVANPLTGETVGDTSQFEADAKELANTPRFTGTIKLLLVKGTKLENIAFRYPEGNE